MSKISNIEKNKLLSFYDIKWKIIKFENINFKTFDLSDINILTFDDIYKLVEECDILCVDIYNSNKKLETEFINHNNSKKFNLKELKWWIIYTHLQDFHFINALETNYMPQLYSSYNKPSTYNTLQPKKNYLMVPFSKLDIDNEYASQCYKPYILYILYREDRKLYKRLKPLINSSDPINEILLVYESNFNTINSFIKYYDTKFLNIYKYSSLFLHIIAYINKNTIDYSHYIHLLQNYIKNYLYHIINLKNNNFIIHKLSNEAMSYMSILNKDSVIKYIITVIYIVHNNILAGNSIFSYDSKSNLNSNNLYKILFLYNLNILQYKYFINIYKLLNSDIIQYSDKEFNKILNEWDKSIIDNSNINKYYNYTIIYEYYYIIKKLNMLYTLKNKYYKYKYISLIDCQNMISKKINKIYNKKLHNYPPDIKVKFTNFYYNILNKE
jgi:hypothetical protein